VRACAATGARRRRHIGPPFRIPTTTAVAAAASTLSTRRRAFRGRGGGRGAGLGLRGPGGACPPRHATTAAAAVSVQLALRWERNWAAQWHSPFWGRNWAAQWHLARALGKRFRGCRARRLYVDRDIFTYLAPGTSPLPDAAGAKEPALAPQVTARLALHDTGGTPPSYSAVYAAVSNAPVDVLAEVRALVPGAVPHLSKLNRAMIATADHGGGAAALGPSAAPPPPGSSPALADGPARDSSGRYARTRFPDAPPSADDTSPGSTNPDRRADGAGPAAPRLPVAVQTLDADAVAAARAADIDAASMHVLSALRAAPGPRRPPVQDTPSLKSTISSPRCASSRPRLRPSAPRSTISSCCCTRRSPSGK